MSVDPICVRRQPERRSSWPPNSALDRKSIIHNSLPTPPFFPVCLHSNQRSVPCSFLLFVFIEYQYFFGKHDKARRMQFEPFATSTDRLKGLSGSILDSRPFKAPFCAPDSTLIDTNLDWFRSIMIAANRHRLENGEQAPIKLICFVRFEHFNHS
jgi:hypothetical protein